MPGLGLFPDFMVDSYIVRILLAGLLGACIGLERDIHGRSAGLRTNMLVCVGSAVFMLLSIVIADSFSVPSGEMVLRADPTRIAAQIITGIGFLGAGAIIKYGFTIRGLTTAACLWITSAIGMSCGSGNYEIAVFTTLLAIFVLVILNKVETLFSRDSYRVLKISAHIDTDVSKIIETIKKENIKILNFEEEKLYSERTINLALTIRIHHRGVTDKLSHEIIGAIEEGNHKLIKISWKQF